MKVWVVEHHYDGDRYIHKIVDSEEKAKREIKDGAYQSFEEYEVE